MIAVLLDARHAVSVATHTFGNATAMHDVIINCRFHILGVVQLWRSTSSGARLATPVSITSLHAMAQVLCEQAYSVEIRAHIFHASTWSRHIGLCFMSCRAQLWHLSRVLDR